MKPIVWTIAGSDSSGGAGNQADLLTFQNLGVQGCSIITSVTAQNHHSILSMYHLPSSEIISQITALQEMVPIAIKIGMLGQLSTIDIVLNYLQTYTGRVVLDPVLAASSGQLLSHHPISQYVTALLKLFPYIDLLTPNIPEAELFLNERIRSHADIKRAANALLSLGLKQVLIKGGHATEDTLCQDYWSNGQESCWISTPRYPSKNYRGTGCIFSSALTACLALAYPIKDALVIAKMYISQCIRLTQNNTSNAVVLTHAGWSVEQTDLPYLSDIALERAPTMCEPYVMPQCSLYPIVDSSDWVERLLTLGITTIQLRIKNCPVDVIKKEIRRSVQLAKNKGAMLFINDYWELAILYGASGIHLGQEDLKNIDMSRIHAAKLRLGISTHCYEEVARAHAYYPSYIACGPIFPTTTKYMRFMPQGLDQLKCWRSILSQYPLVAIGGINKDNILEVKATGVQGIAMISAITQAANPIQQTQELMSLIQ